MFGEEKSMDDFFNKQICDRCKKPLHGTRIMSMYNTDCICENCKNKETARDDYDVARDAEMNAVKAGNYNFPGIGYKT